MLDCIDHCRTGNAKGYASKRLNGKPTDMHRAVFFEHNGYLPEVVRHTCDNPRCINPEHLVAGTHADNSRDMVERGRSLLGEQHPDATLSEQDVAWIRQHYVRNSKEFGAPALARKFGVHHCTIQRALKGVTWCGN